MDDLPLIPFADRTAFEAWLEAEHATSPGVWLKLAKKGSGIPSVTFAEAVEVALCFGWIDGQLKGIDDAWYRQRFTPRRPRSRWSKINAGKATMLIEQGRMRPAGLREVEAAKADGRWDAAYDSPRTATVPDDLQEALGREPAVEAAFHALRAGERFSILFQLQSAKRPETRARRIATVVERLRGGAPGG